VDIQPLIDKVGARLSSWKGKLLNRAGRLRLINTVLTSLPTYHLTVFSLQKWAIKKIDKLRRGFLWKGEESVNGGHCLVQWTRCQRSNAVDRQLFRASTVVTLGDGATASFWQSAWLDGLAPMDIYPNLFKLAWRKNRTVKEELVNHNWTRGLWRMQSVQEMACFVNLWDAVQAIQLTDQPDSIRWKWTAHGDYSAKSAYNIQFAGSHGQFISSHIWQAESEGKHKFFTWLLVQSKLLIADNLLKRQWPCEPVCQLCSQEPETADHLILSCCFAKEVWHKMSQWTLGFITMPSTDVLVADWWQNELAGLPKKQRRVKAALLMYTAWNL